jgi:glycosyltransferase involved in cell wall biosynthesis
MEVRVSGFTLVRHGSQFDYPYLESLRSMLPLVDELVINVGFGEDDTLEKIQEFAHKEGQGKVQVFGSDWGLDQPEKKRAGLILSEQTNLALEKCRHDWCVYLQADELLHEGDLSQIRHCIEKNQARNDVEGLLFDYIHFYGSYDVIQKTRSAYRREVRVIRKSAGARSVGDAQSFRKLDGSKLNVVLCGAKIFHYGWVRPPEVMKEKTFFFDQLYHGDPNPKNAQAGVPHTGDNYRYKRIWGLRRFLGTHPKVMSKRIESKGWQWDLESSPRVFVLKDIKKVIFDGIEELTGYRFFEYRSYKLIR